MAVADDRRAIVILGMHRSGTSACARSVSLCGYAVPQDVMPPRADNPKGFWESLSVMRLNDAILKDLGAGWDRPGPFLTQGRTLAQSARLIEDFTLAKYCDQAIAALEKSFGSAPSIVLKDPRLCLLLPLWSEALAALGYEQRFVFIYRNPLEVAASLNKRNQLPVRRAMQLWLYYNLRGLRDAGRCGSDVRVISFQGLLDDPSAVVSQIVGAEAFDRRGPETHAQIRDYVTAADNHFSTIGSALLDAPHIAAPIKDMWRLLESWAETAPEERAETAAGIEDDFNQAMLLAGHVVHARASIETSGTARSANPARPAEGSALRGRKQGVRILHYHLFKNAGTSVDAMLRENFGAHWSEQEFPAPGHRSNRDQVTAFLRQRPELVALSSHTALLPVPEIEGERIIPVMFLRHPIIRISSAYTFEKRQDAQNFSSQLAKETDFAGYVRGHIDHPTHRGLKNFQTFRLAYNEPDSADPELARALRALDALPFIGLVEAYDRSVERFEALIRPFFPNFAAIVVRRNVTQSERATLEEELARIRDELGLDLYAELVEHNRDDLELFAELSRRYAVAG